MMKITFHGGAQTVTGSQHLLDINGSKILLDCGLYQGRRADSYQRNLNFPFNPKDIDLVILSHAHIDHSGNLPNLIKQGFSGDIICTSATRDLAATMLPDSGYIQERDVEFLNKQKRRQGEESVEPLYTQEDAVAALNYFVTQSYHRRRRIAPDVSLTFYEAGHMLGSAITQLNIFDQNRKRDLTLIFSGDLGRKGIPIIRDPELIVGGDILIMESTYGNRLHEPYFDSEVRLKNIVNDTYQRGGSIVMPAFAVGRTQQLVITLHELIKRGDIPSIPIYVDSPLAVNATSVFQLHPEFYDDELQSFIDEFNVRHPFGFPDLNYVRSVEDSKKLNDLTEPHIIISASGMAEFGRVLHHLKHRVQDRKNTILITGWQAPHTLGRRMVDGERIIKIFGHEYTLNAHVEVLNGFSGHADRDELLGWVDAMQEKPSQVFLVHGEEASANAFKESLDNHYPDMTVTVPHLNQSVSV